MAIQPNQNIEIQEVTNPLTFQFVDGANPVKLAGRSSGGMQCYDVDVQFHHGNRKVGMYIHAPTLEVAIEMIEAYGQQFKEMKDTEFNKFQSDHSGKTIFFHALTKEKDGTDRIVFFNPDKFNKALQHTFTPAVSAKTPKAIVISKGILEEIETQVTELKKKKIGKKKQVQTLQNGVNLQLNRNPPVHP